MRGKGETCRWARIRAGRQRIAVVLVITGMLCAGAGAQIDVNETGLHDGANVYGLYAPGIPIPYVNSEAITLFAWGLPAPNPYADVSFNAYGLFNNLGLTNNGAISVTAIGGATEPSSGAAVAHIQAVGLQTHGVGLNNTGAMSVTALGGRASGVEAQADAAAIGLLAANGLVSNSGTLAVSATGGSAYALDYGDANAAAQAVGIQADNGPVRNMGDIVITATGGTASGGGFNTSASVTYVTGIAVTSANDVNNTKNVTITASGGTAVADHGWAYASAENIQGIRAGRDIHNTGDVTVAATAGTASAGGDATAVALATGLQAEGDVSNTGTIRVTAAGGSAQAEGAGEVSTDAGTVSSDGGEIWGVSRSSSDAEAKTKAGTVGLPTNYAMSLIDEMEIPKTSYAPVWAYGIQANGSLDNSGTIEVNATGGFGTSSEFPTDVTARAYGLYLGSNFSTDRGVNNRGDLTVAATGGRTRVWNPAGIGSAYASGIEAYDAPVNNTGRIAVAARGGDGTEAEAEAYGTRVYRSQATNRGAIAVTALGGTAASADTPRANSRAWALWAEGDVANTGTLTVASTSGTATADGSGYMVQSWAFTCAYGIDAQGAVNNSGNVTVAGTGGTASAHRNTEGPADVIVGADVYGIVGSAGANDNSITNSGNITVTAAGGSAVADDSASAGWFGSGISTSAVLNNTGSVLVTASGGTATGRRASAGASTQGLRGENLTNSGAVAVVTTGGMARGEDWAEADASAEGIVGSTVTNRGAISVTATGGTNTGASGHANADARGIRIAGSLNNSGTITVTATAEEGFTSTAYGIQTSSDTRLKNTGVIRATGDTAYELYVASDTTRLTDTYNVTLDSDPDRASLGVADGARLALNHAALTVTGLSGETRWNTEYKLFETQGTGVVDGAFGDVRAVNPNTTATYHNQGTAGSADDTVSLAYTPVASPGTGSAGVEKQTVSRSTNVVNNHMTTALLQGVLFPSSAGLLADAGSTAESLALAEAASEKSQDVFVEPYYSWIDQDADPLGYRANLWGFSAGYERFLGSTLAGLHLGYGRADIGYTGAGYNANSEDQDIVTGGFHGLTTWDPWTLRYALTGFYGRHDYRGLTGLAMDTRETASYDSYGTATTLMAGHIFRWGPHVLLPEAGLDWLWTHRAGYTTAATDPSWNTTYSATNDQDLYAALALRWLSSFRWDEVQVTPSVALGVRQLLTDAQASVWQSVPGAAPVLVRSQQDRTALTLSGCLTLTRGPQALSLAYDGDYAPSTHLHSVWLRYSWLF